MIRTDIDKARLKKRYRAEARFKFYGITAITAASLILITLLGSIITSALPAFTQTYVALDVKIPMPQNSDENISDGIEGINGRSIVRAALFDIFPTITARRDKRNLAKLLSFGAGQTVQTHIAENPEIIGTTTRIFVPSSDELDLLVKGQIERDVDENARLLSNQELAWIDTLIREGRIEKRFARNLFFKSDSREPELAGIAGASIGSLLTLFVTLLISFPLGVMAAIYLQELAPKNRFADLIEVNINNLAAVPSIVFGLLGLAVFIGFFGLPRSAPIVGGLVLALMTLPTIIISTRVALSSVPSSIREAALGIGASRLQVITHHVLPAAMPGVLTGTIIGLARAAGETAPLLMIGMLAFIVDIPKTLGDKATVLPAQIYMWSNNPERAFEARTSAAIIILLTVLLLVNATAIIARRHYEKNGSMGSK